MKALARITAVDSLAKVRCGPTGVQALTRALTDPEEDVRAAAARALGAQGSDAAGAVPALEKSLLKDPSKVAQKAAQIAIETIRGG